MTKAAALLHITQPTLSRQIMQLEDELGVKLFIRSNHSIVLTEHGKLLQRRAQEIIDMTEKTKKEIIDDETPGGELSIGSGDYKSSRFLARLMGDFHALYPNVTYRVYSANADDIKQHIENGSLDVGFIVKPVALDRYAFLSCPERERYGVYVHADNPIAKRQCVTPQDLIGIPLAIASRSSVVEMIQNWFGDYAQQMNIVACGNLPYNMLALVAQNIATFCCIELNYSVPDTVFVPLRPAFELTPVLVWKRTPTLSVTLKAFVEFAKKTIEDAQMIATDG